MSSQPLDRSRFASAATATSRLLVANETEMNAPIDMMKTITPIWPKILPTVSVLTKLVSGLRSPYTPLTGARTSCCSVSPKSSGEGTWWKLPGIGEPSAAVLYWPAGRNSAAIQTSSVTMASVVTADGNWNDRLALGLGSAFEAASVATAGSLAQNSMGRGS